MSGPLVTGAALIPKVFPLLERCVEDGVGYGWMRAHKYSDKPDENTIKQQIHDAVMNSICEAFDFVPGTTDEG